MAQITKPASHISKAKVGRLVSDAWTRATLGPEVLALKVNALVVSISEMAEDEAAEMVAPEVAGWLKFREAEKAKAESLKAAADAE